jgi:hypothetical protein
MKWPLDSYAEPNETPLTVNTRRMGRKFQDQMLNTLLETGTHNSPSGMTAGIMMVRLQKLGRPYLLSYYPAENGIAPHFVLRIV